MKDISLLAEFMITVGFLTRIHVFSTINNLEFTWNFNTVLKKKSNAENVKVYLQKWEFN